MAARGSAPTRAAIAAFLAASLSLSCVGLAARVELPADGSVRLILSSYRVPSAVAALGSLEGRDRIIPFAVERADLEADIAAVEGSTLVSYARRVEGPDIVVEAVLAFASRESFAAFLARGGRRLEFTPGPAGQNRLVLELTPGYAGLDPALARLADAAFAPYDVDLVLVPPARVSSAGIGAAAPGGAEARYRARSAVLAKSAAPVLWEIRY